MRVREKKKPIREDWLFPEEWRARKGETPPLAKHSFARGRTPAALRRAGNPRACKEKSQPEKVGFFLESGAPGRRQAKESLVKDSRGLPLFFLSAQIVARADPTSAA